MSVASSERMHEPERALSTVTHARIRARQGDLATARRILSAILEDRPEDARARELLAEMGEGSGQRPERSGDASDQDAAPSGPETSSAVVADGDAVVDRLERWMERIRKNAGAPDAG